MVLTRAPCSLCPPRPRACSSCAGPRTPQALSFTGGGRHSARSVSASLLSAPTASVTITASVHGDSARCLDVSPSSATIDADDWAAVAWFEVAWQDASCVARPSALLLDVRSADRAYNMRDALEVALLVEESAPGSVTGLQAIGCFASMPAEHRRVLPPGTGESAEACHAVCASDGYDYFVLTSGACYCAPAAAVDRELPLDALPTHECDGSDQGPRRYHLYRSISLGYPMGDSAVAHALRDSPVPYGLDGVVHLNTPLKRSRSPAAAFLACVLGAALLTATVATARALGRSRDQDISVSAGYGDG